MQIQGKFAKISDKQSKNEFRSESVNTEQSDSFITDDSDDEFESNIDSEKKSDASDEPEKSQRKLDKGKLLSLQKQRKLINDNNEKDAYKLQTEIDVLRKNLGLPNETTNDEKLLDFQSKLLTAVMNIYKPVRNVNYHQPNE